MTEQNDSSWLPPSRVENPKRISMQLIKSTSHKDWFMNLAWNIFETYQDQTQCRMLAKVYLFLRDFLPRGFTGRYAHIRGDHVMHHLLCHEGEHASSRHRATVQADLAFKELEAWMAKGSGWEEALENSDKTVKRKSHRAPGLHTPEGIMAILIIAHPDARFRERINHLGIDWMISPTRTLEVKQGYWKGVNASNLYSCFRMEENRESTVLIRADYNQLLGGGFVEARRDMRPYLPAWATGLTLVEEPEDLDDAAAAGDDNAGHGGDVGDDMDDHRAGHGVTAVLDNDGDGSAGHEHPSAVVELRRHLYPSTSDTLEGLKQWLVGRLTTNPGETLSAWLDHWAGRVDAAETYGEQLVIRSLFELSLRRLKGLSGSTQPLSATEDATLPAYTLLDIEDAGLEPRTADPETSGRLAASPAFAQFTDVTNELLRRAAPNGPATRSLLERLMAQRGPLFWDLMRHESFAKYAKAVMELEVLRTQVLLGEDEDKPGGDVPATILQQPTISRLRLTEWQVRQLAIPGAQLGDVLTDCQSRMFLSLGDTEDSQYLQVLSAPPSTAQRTGTAEVARHGEALRKLFGKLLEPHVRSHVRGAPESPLSTTAAEIPRATRTTRSSRAREMSQSTDISQATEVSRAADTLHTTETSATETSDPAEQPQLSRKVRSDTPVSGPSSRLTDLVADSIHVQVPPPAAPSVENRSPDQPTHHPMRDLFPTTKKSSLAEQITTPLSSSKQANTPARHPMLGLFSERKRGVKREADGSPKAHTRVFDMTMEDLRAGLGGGRLEQQLAALETGTEELKRQLTTTRDNAESSADDLKQQLRLLRDEIKEELADTKQSLTAQLRADVAALRKEMQTRLDTAGATGGDTFDELRDLRTTIDERFQHNLREMRTDILKVRDLLARKPPGPGEDGFLTAECPAPDGWSQQICT